MKQVELVNFENIISIENLLLAWKEFLRGKRKKKDVQEFQLHLMDNILSLNADLKNKTYIHGGYYAFNISDPKPRNIHKAGVRDRLLHHAIYRILYPYFDKKFISDSYSCRLNKGTHKAINRFMSKCLFDTDILWLLSQVIDSFQTQNPIYAIADKKKGLPLGNLTSQLLVNIYMNEFDQFVKRQLKVKYYIRYADDFVILQNDKTELQDILSKISFFLSESLKLSLHPDKVFIKTIASGVDFLGWVNFPKHRVLRTVTKNRMLNNIKHNPKPETVQSYLGMLSHGNTNKLTTSISLLKKEKMG